MIRIPSGTPHSVQFQKPSVTLAKTPVQHGRRTFSSMASSPIRFIQTGKGSAALLFTKGNLKKRMIKQAPTPAVTVLVVATSKSKAGYAVVKPPCFDHSTHAKKTKTTLPSTRGSQSRASGQMLKKGRIPLTPSIGTGKMARARIKERAMASQTKTPKQSAPSKPVSDECFSTHNDTAIVSSDHPTAKK